MGKGRKEKRKGGREGGRAGRGRKEGRQSLPFWEHREIWGAGRRAGQPESIHARTRAGPSRK